MTPVIDKTLQDLIAEGHTLRKALQAAIADQKTTGPALAGAEFAYRKKKSAAFQDAPDGTVPEKTAWVQAETAELRKTRDTALYNRQDSMAYQRALLAMLSELQSEMRAWRDEIGIARNA